MATINDLVFRAMLRDEMSVPLKRLAAQMAALQASNNRGGAAARRAANSITFSGTSATHTARAFQALQNRLNSVGGMYGRTATLAGVASRSLGLLHSGGTKVLSMFGKLGRGVGSFLASAGESFLKWAKRGAIALGVLAVAGLKWSFELAMQLEQAQAGFTRLFGSASKATEFLDGLKKWSLRTPFKLTDLIGYSQQLVALGNSGKQTMAVMQALGDAVSSAGRVGQFSEVLTVFNRVVATQRIAARDLGAFARGGIDVGSIIDSTLHITKDQRAKLLSSRGGTQEIYRRLGGQTGLTMLIEAKYKGGLGAQAKTLKGVFTSVKDIVQLGLAEAERPFLQWTGKFLNKHLPAIIDGMTRFGKFFSRAMGALGRGNLRAGGSLLANAFGLGKGAADVFETILHVFRAIGSVVGSVFKGIADGISKAYGGIADGKGKTKSLSDFADRIRKNGPAIVKAVSGAITWGAMVVRKVWPVIKFVGEALIKITQLAIHWGQSINNWWQRDGHTVIAVIHGIGEAVTTVHNLISKFIDIVKAIGRIGAAAFGWVGRTVKWVGDKVQKVIGWVKTLIHWIQKIPKFKLPGWDGSNLGKKAANAEVGQGIARVGANLSAAFGGMNWTQHSMTGSTGVLAPGITVDPDTGTMLRDPRYMPNNQTAVMNPTNGAVMNPTSPTNVININGAQDPHLVAALVANALKKVDRDLRER